MGKKSKDKNKGNVSNNIEDYTNETAQNERELVTNDEISSKKVKSKKSYKVLADVVLSCRKKDNQGKIKVVLEKLKKDQEVDSNFLESLGLSESDIKLEIEKGVISKNN